MQHPAIAEEMLHDLAAEHLGIAYPETGPEQPPMDAAAD
jgi:hypothetical protein